VKPAPFAYRAPADLAGALALLGEHGDEARVLAGGQSLGPMLNLRLARPAIVVDVNRIEALAGITSLPGGGAAVGATTRQRSAETSTRLRSGWPALVTAIGQIGHRTIRNRGTVGGSVAHADPAAELPAVLTALGATIIADGPAGRREVPAADFFVGPFTTALLPGELLVAIGLPAPAPGTAQVWVEFSRRPGDFALVGAAVVVARDADGTCRDAALVYAGVGWTPWRAREAEQVLGDRPLTAALAAEAAAAAADACTPSTDIHATAAHRTLLVETLTRRALLRILEAGE